MISLLYIGGMFHGIFIASLAAHYLNDDRKRLRTALVGLGLALCFAGSGVVVADLLGLGA